VDLADASIIVLTGVQRSWTSGTCCWSMHVTRISITHSWF